MADKTRTDRQGHVLAIVQSSTSKGKTTWTDEEGTKDKKSKGGRVRESKKTEARVTERQAGTRTNEHTSKGQRPTWRNCERYRTKTGATLSTQERKHRRRRKEINSKAIAKRGERRNGKSVQKQEQQECLGTRAKQTNASMQ